MLGMIPKPAPQPMVYVPLSSEFQGLSAAQRVAIAPPPTPDEASKRVFELEKEVAMLRQRVEEYRNPCIQQFVLVLRDAFKEKSKDTMLECIESYKQIHPELSIPEISERLLRGSLEFWCKELSANSDKSSELERKWKNELDAVKKQLADTEASLYEIDGENKIDRYRRKYYSLLVCNPETGEPVVCPFTGEVETKAQRYEKERNQALAEVERLQQRMPSDETNALLARTKKKARVFKRKYYYLKTYLLENQYMSDFSDKHCDSDRGHDEDSDVELRAERSVVVQHRLHDPSIPMGFSVRPASPDS